MAIATMKRRALATAGNVARRIPADRAQFFAFLASPAVRADPWAIYQRLHAGRSVRPTRFGVTLVSSHAGVRQVLREPATSVDESRAIGLRGFASSTEAASGDFSALLERSLLFTDPPDHARIRRLVARAFTPRTVAAQRPDIERLVDEMIGALRPEGGADLLARVAFPLPVAVICELLGVPERDRPRFTGWAAHLAPRLDVSLFRDAEKERRGDIAAHELATFLEELVDHPARREPDGLLSALAEVEEAGDRLTRDEVVALAALLLLAGFETTANLVGNGVLALIRNPAQLARLRHDRVDVAVAVEELLRHDGPVQLTQRIALDDLDVEGDHIEAGTLVALLLGAANRDPRVFPSPDHLDLGRDPNPHLAFSSGIHRCLGAALARLEAAVVIPAIVRGLPGLRLTDRPAWRDTFLLRGLRSLPVAWRA